MKTFILLLTILILSGCSTMSAIFDASASGNDKALIAAEATICRAASIGSIMRRYDTEKKAHAWKELCTNDNNSVPIILEN